MIRGGPAGPQWRCAGQTAKRVPLRVCATAGWRCSTARRRVRFTHVNTRLLSLPELSPGYNQTLSSYHRNIGQSSDRPRGRQ
jgi:hypothetical protein